MMSFAERRGRETRYVSEDEIECEVVHKDNGSGLEHQMCSREELGVLTVVQMSRRQK